LKIGNHISGGVFVLLDVIHAFIHVFFHPLKTKLHQPEVSGRIAGPITLIGSLFDIRPYFVDLSSVFIQPLSGDRQANSHYGNR